MPLINALMDLVAPDACVLCQQSQAERQPHLLCHFCWAALPRNVSCCLHCAVPLASPGVCRVCQSKPLTSGTAIAPLVHQQEARYLVHQLKYANGLRAGQTLAMAMVDAIRLRYRSKSLPEAVIPVPLSYRNQVRRGYNQAAWLAHHVARALQLPVFFGPIKRRHGPAQHTLPRSQRLGLLPQAFAMSAPLPFSHVAILDDVLTTGGTARALAELLSDHGATNMDLWVATRAA